MERNKDKDIIDRYRARYRLQDKFFSGLNKGASVFLGRRNTSIPVSPRRILVANAGHLGDAILSTYVFPVLRHAFPGASLDFLGSTFGRPVLEGHPMLDRAIFLDHWRVARAQRTRIGEIARFYAHVPSAVRTLRASSYDMALDLHAWHPDYLPLFWLAGIPVRAGFDRISGAFATHPVSFSYDRRHEVESFLDVLRSVGVGEASLCQARLSLKPVSDEDRAQADTLTGSLGRYRILHPGSSKPIKDWTIDGWAELARRLADRGIIPVITGSGRRDAEMAQEISRREPGVMSIVNATSWGVLMAIIQGAEIVYSVDTSIGHAARALGRPVVAIFGGMTDPMHWAPPGARVATHDLPCSPCFNKRGCSTRGCLTLLSVDSVEKAAEEALSDMGTSRR
jgi:ADP-heptose:LPS heptosyltransferase